MNTRYRRDAFKALIVFLPFVAVGQSADGKHPGYLHALTDLRAARGLLNQPGDSVVSGDERKAASEIDAAINEIKGASIDDGKDRNDQPAVDVKEHGSRLLKSMETLHQAHTDIEREETGPDVKGLRHRVLDHIDQANVAADHAHSTWLQQDHKK